MKQTIVFLISLCIAAFSCEKESEPAGFPINEIINTTIKSKQIFEYSFGYFGDEEGISIISYPQHSKSCELLNKQWEERILRYVPADAFLGADTVLVRTMRGSDGASPSTEIDTITIAVNVVEDNP